MFYLNRLFTLQEQLGPELVDEHNFLNLSCGILYVSAMANQIGLLLMSLVLLFKGTDLTCKFDEYKTLRKF
jgi:Zn-dependent membrane protease YugP